MLIKHKGSTQGEAYAILIDTSNRPVAMFGRIDPKSTVNRTSPPAPYCGFDTSNTPFDRGHIMALELNGPDITENIVPQYRYWQQSGQWRQNETNMVAAPNAKNANFVAQLIYTAWPDTYTAQQKQFLAFEIFDWTDSRLPVEITTWFFKSGDPLSVKIETVLTKSAAPDEKTLRSLLSDVVKETRYNTNPLKQDTMPPEDIVQWKNVQIREAANNAYNTYLNNRIADIAAAAQQFVTTPVNGLTEKEEKEAIDVMRSPERTEVEFWTNQCPEIRDELINQYGWSTQEAASLNSGRIGNVCIDPWGKRMQTSAAKKHAEYEVKYTKWEKKRNHYRNKGAPYPASLRQNGSYMGASNP